MASKLGLLSLVFIIASLMQFQTFVVAQSQRPPPQVPCYFIFGDALVDNGNNNNLQTQAKANYPPYGIDFPQGPTGRFTNGLTSPDVIGQFLGLSELIPPYATASGQEIVRGVNYGSGGAGIFDETGENLGERINMYKQLIHHAITVSRLRDLQRDKTFTTEYIKKCIYIVDIGSNDYINNYLMPQEYPKGRIYTPDQFAQLLIKKYSIQLKTLYKLGARKIVVFGLGDIGCTPLEIAKFGTNGAPCVESINNMVKLFDNRLKPLVDDLNNESSDARYTYINISSISKSLDGVVLSNIPCCQTRADGQCVPNSIPCPNRDVVTWFDALHPTQIVKRALATRAYKKASPMDASPYDISELARL